MIDDNVPLDEWEQFVRENAVALVNERDEKIARLRKRIRLLEKSLADRRRFERKKQRQTLHPRVVEDAS